MQKGSDVILCTVIGRSDVDAVTKGMVTKGRAPVGD